MNEKLKMFYKYVEQNYNTYKKANEDKINLEINHFRNLYPLANLGNLKLEDYDQLKYTDSFMNLIENGTSSTGSGSIDNNTNKYFYHDSKTNQYKVKKSSSLDKYKGLTINEQFSEYINDMKSFIDSFNPNTYKYNYKEFLATSNVIKTKLILLYYDNYLLSIITPAKINFILNEFNFPKIKNTDNITLNLYLIKQLETNYQDFFIKYPNKIVVSGLLWDFLFIESKYIDLDDKEDSDYKNEFDDELITDDNDELRLAPPLRDIGNVKAYDRDPKQKNKAIKRANYKCSFDYNHETFISKSTNKNYLEAHHIIPRTKQADYIHDIDDYRNIIVLCSHCHNLIHYGLFKDKKPYLDKIYNEREKELKELLIRKDKKQLDLKMLYEYYK